LEIWNWSAAPHSAGGYREGESENSDRDGRESKGNGDYQWRNGLMEKKKKVSLGKPFKRFAAFCVQLHI
jgi:hypothetical protein